MLITSLAQITGFRASFHCNAAAADRPAAADGAGRRAERRAAAADQDGTASKLSDRLHFILHDPIWAKLYRLFSSSATRAAV